MALDFDKIVVVEDDGDTVGFEGEVFGLLIGQRGLQGERGPQGEQGVAGETGEAGNGIVSIAKTSTSGLVDTYTITMTDGTTATFTVTNASGAEWGNIGGTLSDQTDLNTALSLKANVADLGTMASINDAPSDGSEYVRKNGAWSVASGGGVSYTEVTYYVDASSGSDSNDGTTSSTPFATLQKAVDACPYVGRGTIIVNAGTYTTATINDKYITFNAQGVLTLNGITATNSRIELAAVNQSINAYTIASDADGFSFTSCNVNATGRIKVLSNSPVVFTRSTAYLYWLYISANSAGTSVLQATQASQVFVYSAHNSGSGTAILATQGSVVGYESCTGSTSTETGGRIYTGSQS